MIKNLVKHFLPNAVQWLLIPKALSQVPHWQIVRYLLSIDLWPRSSGYDRKSHVLTVAESGIRVRWDKEYGMAAEADGLSVAVEDKGDFDTVHEVLVKREYEWLLAQIAFRPCIVWDVGLNIGTASLLFARVDTAQNVYAYEPFAGTFQRALLTLRLNPAYAEKIVPVQAGVAGSRRTEVFEFSHKGKASLGLLGHSAQTREAYHIRPDEVTPETVQMEDAAAIVSELRARHPHLPLILKLDAEGAEYEILERLRETGLLREVMAAMIECHLEVRPEGGAEMQKLLEQAGLAVVRETKVPDRAEILKAARSR